jgi:hypothetical protein
MSAKLQEECMPRGRPRKTEKDVLLKSAEMLGWALGGLEREIAQTRERLTALTAQATKLRERLGRGVTGRSVPTAARARRTLRPAAVHDGAGGCRRKRASAFPR